MDFHSDCVCWFGRVWLITFSDLLQHWSSRWIYWWSRQLKMGDELVLGGSQAAVQLIWGEAADNYSGAADSGWTWCNLFALPKQLFSLKKFDTCPALCCCDSVLCLCIVCLCCCRLVSPGGIVCQQTITQCPLTDSSFLRANCKRQWAIPGRGLIKDQHGGCYGFSYH